MTIFLFRVALLLSLLLLPSCNGIWNPLGGKAKGDSGELDFLKNEKKVEDPVVGTDTNDDVVADDDGVFVEKEKDEQVEYGVDVSFPIHHSKISDNFAWLPHNLDPEHVKTPEQYKNKAVNPLGDRQKFYDEFLDSCIKYYGRKGGSRCLASEQGRYEMSLRQPKSMRNYTDLGYQKIKTPDSLFKLIKEFWDANKDKAKPEQWGVANTYTNNWQCPTYMVSVEDSSLRGGGYSLKQKIWDHARNTISEWTGQELTPCSLYGIRVYKEGAILGTHVDRLPLVSSAIINVAQDVDEPWPLEVYGHDGRAENVTMLPGDMVMYESHSVLHGRPFPLKGRFLANIFVHFEPVGHSLRHHGMVAEGKDVHKKYKDDFLNGNSGHENNNDGLPPYLVSGSEEEANWRMSHPESRKKGYAAKKAKKFTTGSTELHYAAQKGDVDMAKQHIKDQGPKKVNAKDENGWTPLHEASRRGHFELIKLLVENGAQVNATTKSGESALYMIKKHKSKESSIIEFLESVGAAEIGPDL